MRGIVCARTIRPPRLHQLLRVRRVGRPAAHASLVKHEEDGLRILAALAAQACQKPLNLVEVELGVLEVLVEHADVRAVDDCVKRAVACGPFDEAARVCACISGHAATWL